MKKLFSIFIFFSFLSCSNSNSNINADAKKVCELISEFNFLEIQKIASKYDAGEWESALIKNCEAAEMLYGIGESLQENGIEFMNEFSDELESYSEEIEEALEGYEDEMEKALSEMEEALSELEDAFDY